MFVVICHRYYSCLKDFWPDFPTKSQQEPEQATSPPVRHTSPAFKVGMATSSEQFSVQDTSLSHHHSSTQSPLMSHVLDGNLSYSIPVATPAQKSCDSVASPPYSASVRRPSTTSVQQFHDSAFSSPSYIGSPGAKFSMKAAPVGKQKKPSVHAYEEPLMIANYHLKFLELLKFEETAHQELLEERSVYCFVSPS